MAFKYREEIVGKRFLAVRNPGKLKLSKISEWEWRGGFIRAISHKNSTVHELQVLVEFDDIDWTRREWIRIHEIFAVFLVENTLVYAHRSDPFKPRHQKVWWPALNFKPLVDKVGIANGKLKPVWWLVKESEEKSPTFFEDSDVKPFKEEDLNNPGPCRDYPSVKQAIHCWTQYQDGQSILLTTPSVLIGERVKVYRAEGTTQWYTAVIKSYNDTTKELNITDDTVLEEHNEDPALIQMELLGDGVVDSILRGTDVGTTPRVTRRGTNKDKEKEQTQSHSRNRAQSPQHTAAVTKQTQNRKSRQRFAEQPVEVSEKVREKSPEKQTVKSRSSRDRKRKVEEPPAVVEETPKKTQQGPLKKVKSEKSPEKTAVIALSDIAESVSEVFQSKGKTREKKERKVKSSEERLPVNEQTDKEGSPVKEVTKAKRPKSTKKEPKELPTEIVSATSSEENTGKGKEKKRRKNKEKEVKESTEKTVKEKKSRRKREKKAVHVTKENDSLSADGVDSQDDDMHFKKVQLLSLEKEEKQKAESLSANINVNHSVTDQIAKLHGVRADKVYENNDSNQSAASTTIYNNESDSAGSPQKLKEDVLQTRTKREENISSGVQQTSGNNEDRKSNSDFDKRCTSKTSTSSSPLVSDKNKPVQVYRDPALIKKDAEARQQIAALQQQSGLIHGRHLPTTTSAQSVATYTPIPHGISSIPPGHHPLQATATAAAVRPSQILQPMPYPMSGLSPHILPHHTNSIAALNALATQGINDPMVAAARTQLQLQYHLLQEQQRFPHASFQVHPNVSATQQLEALWQQKYPTIPLPPGWMLAQFQDELLRDHNIMQREREILVERERMERERQERERKERERIEREKVEKERAERERSERERVERERQDNERRDRERIMQEQERRRETERIIRESASADLAVDRHFTESLRLASQKAQSAGTWTPSISAGLPKQPTNPSKPSPSEQSREHKDTLVEEKLRQEREKERMRQQQHNELEKRVFQENFHKDVFMQTQESLIQKQNEEKRKLHLQQEEMLKRFHMEHHQKLLQEQAFKDPKLYEQLVKEGGMHPYFMFSHPGSTASSTLAAYASNATSISGQQSTSKADAPKFNLYGYQQYQQPIYVSQEKLQAHGLDKAPGNLNVKDSNTDSKNLLQGSVVSEKKRGLTSPPPLIKDGHSAHKSVIVENKNRDSNSSSKSSSSPRESVPTRPLSPQSHYKLLLQQQYLAYPATHADMKVSRTQSPLRVASPQQLSQAVMQPMELQRVGKNSSETSCATSVSGSSHSIYGPAAQYLATIAQPPVSTSVAYSLIQQGLIPKPEYSHTSALNATKISDVVANNSSLSALATMTPPGMKDTKRRSVPNPKDQGPRNLKKPKLEPGLTSTTCQNSTDTNSNAASSLSPSASLLFPTSGKTNGTGFMDSFRSFVESTVQNAFYQETELEKAANRQTNLHLSTNSLPVALSTSHNATLSTSHNAAPTPSSISTNDCKSNPVSSIVDTINRVANGIVDTDSDTLSAPSPPPHIRNGDVTLSPSKSGNQMKLKKAWLQRHSGEDSQEKGSTGSSSGSPTTKEQKDFPSLSPTDDKSSLGDLPNGSVNVKELFPVQPDNGDSTTSASETESQGSNTSNPMKRRVKTRRKHLESKKSKTDSSSETGSKKRSLLSRRNKEVKEEGDSKKGLLSDRLNDLKNEDSRSSVSDSEVKDKRKSRSRGKETLAIKQEAVKLELKPAFNINKPLNKLPVAKLKKTMEAFLQDGPCTEVTPKLMKCRECKMTPNQRNKKIPNIFCRFYAFRRLRYSQKGYIKLAGFSESSDAENDDIWPWMPHYPTIEPCIDVDTAKYIVKNVGDQFCKLVEQEKEVVSWYKNGATIAWKRAVQGVREMCDVCDTTLFNMHWVCDKCGFVVCLDCYRVKKDKPVSEYELEDSSKEGDRDEHQWLKCSVNRQPHEAEKLMLTQIIPADALWEVGRHIHDIRKKWGIKARCPCGGSNDLPEIPPKNGINQLLNASTEKALVNGIGRDDHSLKINNKKLNAAFFDQNTSIGPLTNNIGGKMGFVDSNPLALLADAASMDSEKSRDKHAEHVHMINKVKEKLNASEYPFLDTKAHTVTTQSALTNSLPTGSKNGNVYDVENLDADKKSSSCATLRELLTKKVGPQQNNAENNKKARTKVKSLEEIIQTVVERNLPRENPTPLFSEPKQEIKLLHYVPRSGNTLMGRSEPIPAHTLTETSVLFPDVPHSWLCDGQLLRLHDPAHRNNLPLFQERWSLGQPVLVSNVTSRMKIKELWSPESFSKGFGHLENDLVDCKSGVVLIGHDMRDFWDGFECMEKRVKDEESNEPIILKLKDWPTGEDFSELLPTRFQDLMQALPLPEYTNRQGKLNLAARLPEFFVKPDLGPKMYNAYGMASHPKEASTNLHLDISDAVNVMVYVGIPQENQAEQVASALKAIDDVGCDIITRRRVRESCEIPGALWHIFDAHDADKIRDLLNKVAKERGESIEDDHDAIHDQSWYLDNELQDRLKKEYGVKGYQIVQCAGDAIFIPAGAPHQVRNLHSCIKVAEDFVSPEHLNHCFRMTQEFRLLSDTHSNHEDKLQVKNIIFHAVKDAVAVLSANHPKDFQ